MTENVKAVGMGQATYETEQYESHIPSSIQADTLFTFTTELKYLIASITGSALYPRYCEEDIKYLGIEDMDKIFIPMKCFCDINLHRIKCHLDWYGNYGLAFPKEWGMKMGIQPVQYINPKSKLCEDFSEVFNMALKNASSKNSKMEKSLKNYLLHELMYYKPYEGIMRNRKTDIYEMKCFTDECEWRFIPKLEGTGFQQIYYDTSLINAGIINDMSNALSYLKSALLNFKYSDLKYIIINSMSDFYELTSAVNKLNISNNEKMELISKIIVWEKAEGDF